MSTRQNVIDQGAPAGNFLNSLLGGQNAGDFLGTMTGMLGAGGLGLAGNLAQMALSKVFSGGKSQADIQREQLNNAMEFNKRNFAQSRQNAAGYQGAAAASDALRHLQQRDSPWLTGIKNTATQDADAQRMGANTMATMGLNNASRSGDKAIKQMTGAAAMAGGPLSGIGAIASQTGQGMSDMYSNMLNQAGQQYLQGSASASNIMSNAAKDAANTANSDFQRYVAPHLVSASYDSNAGSGGITAANSVAGDQVVMPANPLEPAGSYWQKTGGSQGVYNQFLKNASIT